MQKPKDCQHHSSIKDKWNIVAEILVKVIE